VDGALLSVEGLRKEYRRSRLSRQVTFALSADFTVDSPSIIGVLGPNGSGKTTLFELITGSNVPSAGAVMIGGQDVHRVRYAERARLAVHYHQSYQVRRIRRTRPAFMLERARAARPLLHLFDEPQFNPQDGYIGFMLDFFRRLRDEGRVVFVCLHPTDPYHLEILRETCDRFIHVQRGTLRLAADFDALVADPDLQAYLGQAALR
jgi:ABC-type multidrug transport system ATPase subunit